LTGGDTTLNIRWLTAADPAFYETLNRPLADLTLRQLVIAKAVDSLQLAIGKENLFPFLVQPVVGSGTTVEDVPPKWIWDMHASMPKKWENLRLAKIKRISGENSTTSGYSGSMRLIFTANIQNSTTEVAIFYADYKIDSVLTYQLLRFGIVNSLEEGTPIDPGESETVTGFLIFRTLDVLDQAITDFYDLVAPPADTTDSNSDGYYDNPAIYEIIDTIAGGTAVTDDFGTSALSHGTGLLIDSAWNAIPQLDSDIQSWIVSFNYPFDSLANRNSVDNITIPAGIFREFDITVPAGDNPTGDSSGTFYPCWVTRIERIGTGSNQLRFFFGTYNVTDAEIGGSPSTTVIEFASLDLLRTYTEGEIVEISPITNLKLVSGTESTEFEQHFGRGHVVLSSLWNGTTSEVEDFFDEFDLIVVSPPDTEFSQSATRISSFGISRVPKYIPTIGQSRALAGSTARLAMAINPGDENRYVTEQDQGVGNQIDLEAVSGISPNTSIDRYGFTGALTHRIVKLVISANSLGDSPSTYTNDILPRLRVLFGRDPKFGDYWYNGTRLMFYNGDSWQG
tara:strand:+ start:919 stop:2616 length:1698 start_codon:yes stop_codon:yes gene_type:complete